MLQEHLTDAYMAANLVLQDWNNDQPLLWNVDLQHVALAQGQQVVVCPPNTVVVTDAYIQTQIQGLATDETGTPMTDETGALLYSGAGGVPFVNNRVIFSVGRSEFASYPNPLQQAFPTTYWFDRTMPPSIHLYPVPDADQTYFLYYWRFIQSQDAALAGGLQLAIPPRWMMAFSDALALELSFTYAPDKSAGLAMKLNGNGGNIIGSYQRARIAERENVPIYLSPALEFYYQR